MIPSNFTIDEVLKLPSFTLEELKEYVYNLDISSLYQQIKNEVYDLENQINELEEQLDNIYEP
jgi:hypothetical protein